MNLDCIVHIAQLDQGTLRRDLMRDFLGKLILEISSAETFSETAFLRTRVVHSHKWEKE